MAHPAEHVLAGPIVRRVATDRVSVWIALAKPAKVKLSLYPHSQVPGAARTAIATAEVDAIRIGAGLYCALPTIELTGAGQKLKAGEIYDYDVEIDQQNLKQLRLLEDNDIEVKRGDRTVKHRHLALGYAEDLLPSFVVAPEKAKDLVIAHGSCRRPYAQGFDGIVALDQIIETARKGQPVGPRPHFAIFTGDQIYSDDLGVELLSWANDVGVELVGTHDGKPVERLRVELEAKFVAFPADKYHFPPGRRQRIASRVAKLTSGDSWGHAFSFGEIAAHYLMSWCNVVWPERLDDPATWKRLHQERGKQVRAYLTEWYGLQARARATFAKQRAADPSYAADKAHLANRIARIPSAQLLPDASRAIDQFLDPEDLTDWKGIDEGAFKQWEEFWKLDTLPVPKAQPAKSDVAASKFIGERADLAALARLMTPSWYAGKQHCNIAFDDRIPSIFAPTTVDKLDLDDDAVLVHLERLRTFYQSLPNVRRALANVSTLMIFDDHEVTDDWTVTQQWVEDVNASSLGRDIVRNGMAAYVVFQDWGNEPRRYDADSANGKALLAIQTMFAGNEGPPAPAIRALEKAFNLDVTPEDPTPNEQRAEFNFAVTAKDSAYEIVIFDNRTRRGYEKKDDSPANISSESLPVQLDERPPTDAEVSIFVASLPVLGYPPTEEIGQPIGNLRDEILHSHDPHDKHHEEMTFGTIEAEYQFGRLIKDPEAWAFSTHAQEALFARLAKNRKAVVILSGDIHYSLTGQVTYFEQREGKLAPISRFAQLISSALKNEPGGAEAAFAQLGIAEQIGALVAGPYDRLGWQRGSNTAPNFDLTEASRQLKHKLKSDPVVVPVRMLPTTIVRQLRSRALERPPQWAWRFEVVKDLRSDAVRYGLEEAADVLKLPTEEELAADRVAAIRRIADHHVWHALHGFPRRTFFYANLGLVQFERTGDAPLTVVHSLYAWDRSNRGVGGALDLTKPWPEARPQARPYTQHRVSFDIFGTDSSGKLKVLPPDQPNPAEPL